MAGRGGLARVVVGNDIVDGGLAGVPSEQFLARTLSPEERALAERADDLPRFVWRLCAAKEAAYQILASADSRLPFSRRRFRVDPDAEEVHHDRGCVPVRWLESGPALACWGWQGSGVVACRLASVDEAEASAMALTPREAAGDRGSRAACKLGKWLLGVMLDVDPIDLEIRRPSRLLAHGRRVAGPPEPWLGGRRVPGVTISLAHDGRFVSCAVATSGRR